MNTKELIDNLKKVLADNLVAVILHGSFVTKEKADRHSDENLLVITKDLSERTLTQFMPIIKNWAKAGNRMPEIFTEESIRAATDVFPLEYTLIKSAYEVLYGADIFSDLSIDLVHLRHQLEFELRSKLLQLQHRYIATQGDVEEIKTLMAKSLSSFTALFKGVLLFMKKSVPTTKKEVWVSLAQDFGFDQLTWQKIWGFRHGIPLEKEEKVSELFSKYMSSIELIITAIDKKESV